MSIQQLFKQTMDFYGIKGRELALLAGITPAHLSDFRSGKNWVSPEVFSKLLSSMNQIAPGSRQYFCQLLAEEPLQKSTVGERIVDMIELADEDDMEQALAAILTKWKKTRRNTNIPCKDLNSAIAV